MSTPKKILLTALAVILLLGATPLAAQIAGVWEGTGKGAAYPPCHLPIYPWQKWIGEIPNSEDVFFGEWKDTLDNHGRFEGKPAPYSTPDAKVFKGYWTWETPEGIFKGGEFTMTFYFLEGECKGTWTSIWPSPGLPGKMWGRKVE